LDSSAIERIAAALAASDDAYSWDRAPEVMARLSPLDFRIKRVIDFQGDPG